MAKTDPSALVRLYLAAALRRLPLDRRTPIVQALAARAEDAGDRNLPAMIWFAAEPLVTRDRDRGLALARAAKIPDLARSIFRRVSLEPAGLERVTALLDAGQSRGDGERQMILESMVKALEGRGRVPAPARWSGIKEVVYGSDNPLVRRPAETLGAQFSDEEMLARLRIRLGDRRLEIADRRQALATLRSVRDGGALPALQQLLDETDLRRDALRALGRFDDARVAPALLDRYDKFSSAERADTITTLIGRPVSALALLDAMKAGRIPRRDISAFDARQMTRLDSPEVNARLSEIWGTTRQQTAEKSETVTRLEKTYNRFQSWTYDANEGRAVFNRLCVTCHRLFGEGGEVGPDLTESNRGDLSYLLENIVDPGALIGQDFQLSTVKTKDGRFLTGMINRKTDAVLTLQTATEKVTLPRADVLGVETSDASMMPEGLLEGLPDDDLRNLLSYLMSSRQVPLPEPPAAPAPPAKGGLP